MAARRRAPHPDRLITARLHGAALYLANAGRDADDAAADLADLAGGRADLLAEVAGIMRGSCSVEPCTPDYPIAVELLVAAGADAALIAHWTEIGRQRASAPRHSA
jgi:hypothetical protein